jgi:hypothetical protein
MTTPDTLSIRPVADADRTAVGDLFVEINRALAPSSMTETFERAPAAAG